MRTSSEYFITFGCNQTYCQSPRVSAVCFPVNPRNQVRASVILMEFFPTGKAYRMPLAADLSVVFEIHARMFSRYRFLRAYLSLEALTVRGGRAAAAAAAIEEQSSRSEDFSERFNAIPTRFSDFIC